MTALPLCPDQRGDLLQSRVYTCMARKWIGGVVPRALELPSIGLETDNAVIKFYNAMYVVAVFVIFRSCADKRPLVGFNVPHLYHHDRITDIATGMTTIRKQYPGRPDLWQGDHG